MLNFNAATFNLTFNLEHFFVVMNFSIAGHAQLSKLCVFFLNA
jgi:hypothetical protein